MNNSNKDFKPFYIYSDKNCLYIKNINEQKEKIANNIYSYCTNIDNSNNIHICCIDKYGKLLYLFNTNGKWKKRNIHRIFNDTKNIKDMRLYSFDGFINLFIVESNPLNEDLYRVSHINFNTSNYKFYRYNINNILKEKSHIYKLNIDDDSNIIFEYKTLNKSVRSLDNHTIIFNNVDRKWISPKYMRKSYTNDLEITSNIIDDIFEFCYSIKYKI